MNMDPKVIGAQIRMRMPQLTELEKRVVESIISRTDLSEQTSLKEISEENNVSDAMIVKMTKKLNFSGFRDFRTKLVYYKNSEVANLHSEIEANDPSDLLIKKVFRTSIQAIEETMSILDVSEFERAAAILFKARFIDLYGVGGSATVARDFSHKLLKIGVRGMVHEDVHTMMMSSSLLSDSDAVVAISHSGTTKSLIEAIKLASKNGAKIISITNYAESQVAQHSDVVLATTSQGSHLLGENAASRIAQLNILDTLFVAIAQKDLKKAEKNLNKTQQSVKNLREY